MGNTFDTLHNVDSGKHLYQFYKGAEEYFQVMSDFFRAGLEQGDACLWLVSEDKGIHNAWVVAEGKIPHFLSYHASGQIQILPAHEWYLKEGRFDEAQSLDKASQYIEGVFSKGFKRLRGSGDASVIPHEDRDKLRSYEKKIGELIQGHPVVALCAYPILDCALQETKMVLDCHDDVLIGHL